MQFLKVLSIFRAKATPKICGVGTGTPGATVPLKLFLTFGPREFENVNFLQCLAPPSGVILRHIGVL